MNRSQTLGFRGVLGRHAPRACDEGGEDAISRGMTTGRLCRCLSVEPDTIRSRARHPLGGMVSNGKQTKSRHARNKYGSVRQLPSHRWQARLSKRFDPKGRPIPGTFATREEAELAAYSAYTALMRGDLVLPDDEAEEGPAPTPPPTPVTVRETMDALIREHTGLSAKTVDGYKSLSRSVICNPSYGIGDVRVDALTVPQLLAWRHTLEERGLSTSNIRAAFRAFSSALSWAVGMGRLSENLIPRIPRRSTKSSREAAAVDTVVLATWDELQEFTDAIPEPAHRLMVLLLAFTGMRFGELAALEPTSLLHATHELNLDHQWVKGTGKPWAREAPKSGKPRRVYVPEGLWQMLLDYLKTWEPQPEPRLPFIFPSPTAKNGRGIGIWDAAIFGEEVMRPAREKTGVNLRTKDLRAFAASAVVDAGGTHVEAQHMLGHADPMTTMRHYIRAKDAKAHDPKRMAIRTESTLSVDERLDALWHAFHAG